MLKWTIINKRQTEDGQQYTRRHSADVLKCLQNNAIQKPKRRRSSNSRMSSGVVRHRNHNRRSLNIKSEDKENRFTSTPIKSPDECFHFEALRDVSNISPKDGKLSIKNPTPNRNKCLSPKHVKHKKKKRCVDPAHDGQKLLGLPNYLQLIDDVDLKRNSSDACGYGTFNCKSSTPKAITEAYAPTLPTFGVEYSPCGFRATRNVINMNNNEARENILTRIRQSEFDQNCPPYKKPKIDHVNDFLHQISNVHSPEDNHINNHNGMELKISPLVKKLVGLRFTPNRKVNDSSYINNLSLNELVNAILDSSVENNNEESNASDRVIVNICDVPAKKEFESFSDKNSTDSGFKSNTDSHNVGANFACACNIDNLHHLRTEVPGLSCDRTIINIDETFNERCVDIEINTRRRDSATIIDQKSTNEESEGKSFTLKRQRCIRRRRLMEDEKSIHNNHLTNHSSDNNKDQSSMNCTYWYLDNNLNDNSFDSSYYDQQNDHTKSSMKLKISEHENCVLEKDQSVCKTRRCLLFESPVSDSSSSISSSKQAVTGSMELEIKYCSNELILNVLKCHDLSCSQTKSVNAYIKVCLGEGRRKQPGTLQRTPVQAESCRPTFNHTFRLPLLKTDLQKRLFVEVWHRDRICRRSKFLGCMSFSVKNIIKKNIKGHFYLLPQSTGRCQNVPMTTDQVSNLSGDSRTFLQRTDSRGTADRQATMCESQFSVEEVVMNVDDIDGELKKSSVTNKDALSEQQKLADENLFLRYLELDPLEGPDAIPAALQRKATGNKNGRTPFTTTRKLIKQPKTGFGFSVVWTHPPRIERVEKGLPADRAGILPGDYIIFVDKHNVVTMPEIEILNLIRSYGNQLTLEIFRRNTSRNGSVPNVRRLTSIGTESSTVLPAPSLSTQRRPSTICSTTNTTSLEYNRRKLQLPQVTFSAEKPTNSGEDARRKAMYQLISKEQQYATGLQFAVTRFVSALAERKDLITAREHKLLFQNSEELQRISEDIADALIPEDGDPQFHLLGTTYHSKLGEITTAYRKYCAGIKKSDCILANKMRNSNSEFVRFLQCPAIPRRRPDITAFIHKPLEHFRDVLKLFSVILSNTKSNAEDYPVISQIVHDLQITYREITVEGGLMEPLGEGKPLLSVQDLENRLVFTKCKPFVLSKPGRQWIFGGDLSRVEGRNVRQYWALLFTDILLFAKVSRDRVLFIFEEPLSLAHITDLTFNVRKKVNEFRITVEPGGKTVSSPTIHCGPDLTRTPKKNPGRRCFVLRAPTTELKAVWQNLLQRQIFHVNAGMDGSSFSSPLESPEAPITSSVVTLQSPESLSIRRQNPESTIVSDGADTQKHIDELIEFKCKQIGKTNSSHKGGAMHLEQWMKGQLGRGSSSTLHEATPEEENIFEVWTNEMFRKRSEELQLMINEKHVTMGKDHARCESRMEEVSISDIDCSPSRSTTSESQVTVRSSPVVPETLTVCKQCHRTCLTNQNGVSIYASNNNSDRAITTNNNAEQTVSGNKTNRNHSEVTTNEDDWRPLVLMGLNAVNPAASLLKFDPFSAPVPKISIMPPTPDYLRKSDNHSEDNVNNINCNCKEVINDNGYIGNDNENSPDSSPQTEDQPYHSLNSSNVTLRRFGTVSSLERLGSDEQQADAEDELDCEDNSSQSDEDDDDELYEDEDNKGYYNEAFNHSSLRSWSARAGSFVAEKMAIFERLGEDYKAGSRFFERYLRTTEPQMNGDEGQEEETSGATSGEDVWGTPTSGGEMDDPLSSPNFDGRKSPNDDSLSSNDDNTELMMDELLMTPPVTSSAIRGLLPRRTLEPLMEEEYSDTYTSSSSSSSDGSRTDPSGSPEQDNETGNAADVCSTAAESPDRPTTNSEKSDTPTPTPTSERPKKAGPVCPVSCNSIATPPHPPKIHRSESYRHIIEAEDDPLPDPPITLFTRLKPTIKFVNIERIPRSKGVKLLEFFNMKRERKIHESFGTTGKQQINVYTKEDCITNDRMAYVDKPLSPGRLKDKQLDRRFWKQLNKRRGQKPLQLSA